MEAVTKKHVLSISWTGRRVLLQSELLQCYYRAGRWPVAMFYSMLDLASVNTCSTQAYMRSTEKRRVHLAHLAEKICCGFLQEKMVNFD
ncbi:piggyBac transposable element-derived protein 3-like isoform X2 [Clarias magur]|uniref:PiggyBac transposable element-derived protein 3-like isoform X2 n=1 Tax=Clarias magur TaxID=1594786 RepID=A0A8J4X6N8_CLAMG|nr:piggyBac transposable element-derived protein 3-like isoform X2 [Clarias magur]